MKRYIFFDLDGTLTDPMLGITSSVQYALAKFGISVRYLKELIPFIGPPLAESFRQFYGFSGEQAQEAVKYYREYFAPKGIFENEIYPGIPELLENLHNAGFELAVATSKPRVYAERILRHFGIEEYFSFVSGSELDGTRVKKAEVIQYALDAYGIRGKDALMIGDRKHDMEGAAACGVESVGVLYGYGSRQELEEAGAGHIVENVKELQSFLLEQGEKKEEDTTMVRFGFIGTGKIAESFYQANRFINGFVLTAVYSRTMERAREFGFRKGDLVYYDDLEEFSRSDAFDAVYLASPNCYHHDQAIAMMRAGKHVICEKPLASNYREAEEMFAVAEEEGVILMEGMRSIYTPGFQKMTGYMETLGTIRRATFQYCQYSSRYDNFKRGIIENAFKPELSNGALMDIGVYPVACMIRLFGAPKSVKASGVRLSNGVDGEGTILMEYEDMIGEAIYSKITNAVMPSQILGEEGVMQVTEIENVKDLHIRRKTVNQTIHFEQSDNVLNHETAAFIKMVKTGTGWEEARDITLATMKVLDEARRQIGIRFPADEKYEVPEKTEEAEPEETVKDVEKTEEASSEETMKDVKETEEAEPEETVEDVGKTEEAEPEETVEDSEKSEEVPAE